MPSTNVSIKGLDKAKVLKALHDNSKAQGMSFLHLQELSLEDCQSLIQDQTDFDYLAGKVMKVNLAGDEFNPWGYDRDNGEGAAQRAIDSIS
jgi:hypothetical protein